MQEAGKLIDLVQAPVGTLVEDIDGTRIVHANLPIEGEILVLLHSQYPNAVPVKSIEGSMIGRDAKSVRNKLSDMKGRKLLHGDTANGFRLTHAGFLGAVSEINKLAS
jgi:hypothetical protein